jgi:hypothetical protein
MKMPSTDDGSSKGDGIDMREMGRRAAEGGALVTLIDAEESRLISDRDRRLWRKGWREGKKAMIGLSVSY